MGFSQTGIISFVLLLLIFSIQELSCRTPSPTQPTEYNVPYGSERHQVMDIYHPLSPASHPNSSKSVIDDLVSTVVLIIHGGAWKRGRKEDLAQIVGFVRRSWPTALVSNINFRLGTLEDPGYPKQLDDVHSIMDYISANVTKNSNTSYFFIGGSTGGHLALLYGYRNASEGRVKGIVNIVGLHTDATDPSIIFNPVYQLAYFPFVGPYFYFQNPDIYNVTSPVKYINAGSPPTISFYGANDYIVPHAQVAKLHATLTAAGVPNAVTYYSGGHYYEWSPDDTFDMTDRVVAFLDKYV